MATEYVVYAQKRDEKTTEQDEFFKDIFSASPAIFLS